MNHLHQHPDGFIYLRTDAGIYRATLAEFEQDYGMPFPALPDGFTERYYKPGAKHNVQNERGVEGQPLPWPEGDAILAAFDVLMTKQQARENPPTTPEQEQQERNRPYLARISRLEIDSLRAMREALLVATPNGPERARLQQIENEIQAERNKLS